MWVYLEKNGKFMVGFYRPDGTFSNKIDCHDEEQAQRWTSFLNGGKHPSEYENN